MVGGWAGSWTTPFPDWRVLERRPDFKIQRPRPLSQEARELVYKLASKEALNLENNNAGFLERGAPKHSQGHEYQPALLSLNPEPNSCASNIKGVPSRQAAPVALRLWI